MATTHQVGPYTVPDTVLNGIRKASASTGVDFSYMMAKAARESSFQAEVEAGTSSATGLYQFIDQTWLAMVHNHGDKHGLDHVAAQIERDADGRYVVDSAAKRREILDLRKDPGLNAVMAGEFANENGAHLRAATGRDPTPTDLYMAHFLGAGGAGTFINAMTANPDQVGGALFPEAAAANRAVFFDADGNARSLQQIYERFGQQVTRDMDLAADLPNNAAPDPGLWAATGTPPDVQALFSGPRDALPPGPRLADTSRHVGLASQFAGRDLSLWTVLVLSSMATAESDRLRENDAWA